MSLIILTPANLEALKREARTAMPEVRSAHLTEALAAAMGYRTHAALLAAIEADFGRPPDLADCLQSRFVERLDQLGYGGIAAEELDAIVRGDAIPERPYAEFRSGDVDANNRQFYACERGNRPMITLTMARTYVKLNWDCITTTSDHDGYLIGDDNGGTFGQDLFRQFQEHARGAPGKPMFTGGAFVGWIEKLLPDTARNLAEAYYRKLYLPLREPPISRRRRAA